MAWEVFERKIQRSSEPTVTVSKLGRIGFNRAATKVLADAQAHQVLLMWDADGKRFAVKPVPKKDTRAYTVHYAKEQAWSGFAAKTFLAHIKYDYSKTASFSCEWDNAANILVVDLSAAYHNEEPSPLNKFISRPRRRIALENDEGQQKSNTRA